MGENTKGPLTASEHRAAGLAAGALMIWQCTCTLVEEVTYNEVARSLNQHDIKGTAVRSTDDMTSKIS